MSVHSWPASAVTGDGVLQTRVPANNGLHSDAPQAARA